MKYLKIILVLSIFLQFLENKEIDLIRKLEVEDSLDIDTGEPDTIEVSDSNEFPYYNGTSDSFTDSYEFPSHSPAFDTIQTETTLSFVIQDHDPVTTITPSDDNSQPREPVSTSEFSNDLPDHSSNGTLSEVPTLSTYPYTPITTTPKIILLGFGNFQKIETRIS